MSCFLLLICFVWCFILVLFLYYDGLNGCDSRSLSDHNGDDSENNFDRIDVQKKGGKILRLGFINFIVRHIQQKTNFTQTTVNKRTKRLGFWCLSRCRRRSSFFRHCSSGRLLCTRIEYAPWLVRVEGKCKRPSDNWFIRSVWGVEQEPRSYFADVTNCDKITSATQATIRDFKIQRRDGNKNVA